jgi:DNA-directed RNA polymerase specialized sigma24 family protein
LWTLRPAARQVVYLNALEQCDAALVAHCLGLGERRAVHERLYAARRALRGQLAAR